MLRTPFVRVRFARAGVITYRVGVPTPYFVQTLVDELRRAGRVEVELAADADDATLADMRAALALVRARRVRIVRAGSGAAA
jgi:hypothetical protein